MQSLVRLLADEAVPYLAAYRYEIPGLRKQVHTSTRRPLLVRRLDRGLAGRGGVRPGGAAAHAGRAGRAQAGRDRGYGVNFHDNDVFGFDETSAERGERARAFRKALDETGIVVTTATTNLFAHPMFKEGAFTANDGRAPVRAGQGDAQPGSRRRARRGGLVCWGGRDGAETGASKDVLHGAVPAQGSVRCPVRLRASTRATRSGSPSSPSRTRPRRHPAAHGSGTRWRSSTSSSTPSLVGLDPEVGHEEMSGLNYAHGDHAGSVARQAVPHRPERPARGRAWDQDLRFGAGDASVWVVSTLKLGSGKVPLSSNNGHVSVVLHSSPPSYVDKATYSPIWEELYDADMKPWRILALFLQSVNVPGVGMVTDSGASIWAFWDVQHQHSTFFIDPSYGHDFYLNQQSPQEFTDLTRYTSPAGLNLIMR